MPLEVLSHVFLSWSLNLYIHIARYVCVCLCMSGCYGKTIYDLHLQQNNCTQSSKRSAAVMRMEGALLLPQPLLLLLVLLDVVFGQNLTPAQTGLLGYSWWAAFLSDWPTTHTLNCGPTTPTVHHPTCGSQTYLAVFTGSEVNRA